MRALRSDARVMAVDPIDTDHDRVDRRLQARRADRRVRIRLCVGLLQTLPEYDRSIGLTELRAVVADAEAFGETKQIAEEFDGGPDVRIR